MQLLFLLQTSLTEEQILAIVAQVLVSISLVFLLATILAFVRSTTTVIPKANSLPIIKKTNSGSRTVYSLRTHCKSANTHLVLILVVLGGKSKNTVTFSDRLLVLNSLQSNVEEITGEMGLKLVNKELLIFSS